MSDRYPDAQLWMRQACRPLVIRAGTKHAGQEWTIFQTRDPTIVELHRWWTGKRQNNENIALILGPPPGGNLLAVNVNIKNGHDGPGTLQRLGWVMPATPTIHTPSTGLCYFFKVPDPTVSPFPFNTHADTGYDGVEFRGAKGYQLVPTSRTPEGRYEFVPPWTLERFRAELADLPGAILQAWVKLDSRGAKFLARDEPEIIGNPRNRLSVTVPTTDLSQPPAKHPRRSQPRPTHKTPSHYPNTTTVTTVLKIEKDRGFVEGFDVYERECAEAICRCLDVSTETLDDGRPFHCRLPGHGPDHDPSASWFKSPSGYYLYTDWHKRSVERSYTVPEVFAALTSRVVKPLPKPSRMAWRLRLMVEEGWLEPEPVRMKPVPDDGSDLLRRYCEGFRFLVMCKSCHPKTTPNTATPFARAFASHWCGIPKGSIWALQQEAMHRDLIVFAGLYKGQALYRPGKDE